MPMRTCQHLEGWTRDPEIPVSFDAVSQRYLLCRLPTVQFPISYCIFCGGFDRPCQAAQECTCGLLEQWASDSSLAFEFDAALNEFHRGRFVSLVAPDQSEAPELPARLQAACANTPCASQACRPGSNCAARAQNRRTELASRGVGKACPQQKPNKVQKIPLRTAPSTSHRWQCGECSE